MHPQIYLQMHQVAHHQCKISPHPNHPILILGLGMILAMEMAMTTVQWNLPVVTLIATHNTLIASTFARIRLALQLVRSPACRTVTHELAAAEMRAAIKNRTATQPKQQPCLGLMKATTTAIRAMGAQHLQCPIWALT